MVMTFTSLLGLLLLLFLSIISTSVLSCAFIYLWY
ncbi:hypothetical protein CFP56_003035 [Quercus suber]|uniref:Uncharacterized protein n=1 Tax=Quercus suber TaxID=58331 RepID=A0AAW0ICE2_QUESU